MNEWNAVEILLVQLAERSAVAAARLADQRVFPRQG